MLEFLDQRIDKLAESLGELRLLNPRYMILYAAPSGALQSAGALTNIRLLGLTMGFSMSQQRNDSSVPDWGQNREIVVPGAATRSNFSLARTMTLKESLLGFLDNTGRHDFLSARTCNFRADLIMVQEVPQEPDLSPIMWRVVGATVIGYGVDWNIDRHVPIEQTSIRAQEVSLLTT